MSKVVKVVKIWFDDDPPYPGISSGLILELEDGRKLYHSQDGYVKPFGEVKPDPDKRP